MYKDKDKQREADRERQKRRRDVIKSKGVTNQGVTQGVTLVPGPTEGIVDVWQGAMDEQAATEKWAEEKPKRGKDIKCFADLPPDVQMTIDLMSVVDGKIDRTTKVNRTAVAINYQHMFPDRYYPQDAVISSPVCVGKPGDADYNGVCTDEWRAERGG